jgi:hypothetical protein
MKLFDAMSWGQKEQEAAETAALPEDAKVVILVLTEESSTTGSADAAAANRRRFPRCAYQVAATLKKGDGSNADAASAMRMRIYTRDANQWGVGFVAQESIPAGSDAYLILDRPGFARPMHRRCRIVRCREALPGWYEGAAVFHDEEPSLSPEVIG